MGDSVNRPGEEQRRWSYLVSLDDELLIGNSMCSEWSTFLVRDAGVAFCAGANLAALFAAVAGIEAHLRYEYFPSEGSNLRLFQIIDEAPISEELRTGLHELRRLRNSWTHVRDPHADEHLLERPDVEETSIREAAFRAMRLLREVLYLEQGT